MIINEFKRLLSQPQSKALIVFIMISFLLLSLYSPSSSEYEEIYKEYGDNIGKFFEANDQGILNYNEGTDYFYDQVDYINGYSEKVKDRLNELEVKSEIGLFSSPSDQKRINKEKLFYKSLSEENIEIQSIYKVDKVLRDRSIHYLIPLISCILIILIFSEDIKKETLSLFMTTKNNLSKLFWVKSFVYLTFMTLLIVLLGFVTFLRTGFSTLPIHSIPYFKEVMGNYSVFIFIVKESLNLFVNSILAGYGLLILFIIFKNQALAFVGIISLYFVQAILYLFIPVNNVLAYLKYFNLFYLTFIDRLNFMVINNSITTFMTSLVLIVLIMAYLFYRNYKHWNISINKGIPLRTTSLTFHSIYQLLISYRGLIMIMIVLLFSFYNIKGFSVSSNPYEKSYQIFKGKYLGPIDSSLEDRIVEDKDIINKAYEESLILKDYIDLHPEEANKIYSENDQTFTMARDYENMDRLISELEEAKSLGVADLVDTRGTDLLFMKKQLIFRIQNMLVLIVPIFIFGFYQGMSSFNKESLGLVYPSKSSIRPYLGSQAISLILLSFTSVFILMSLHYFKIARELPINLSNSLRQAIVINMDIPIWQGLIFLYLLISIISSAIGLIAQGIVRYAILRGKSSD